MLKDIGLDAVPVTSGSKGIHLYAGLDGSQDADYVNAFAQELARALESELPELVVSDMKKSLRKDKVLVDWSQNNASKTTIAPYSLRGTLQPNVATPRTWKELDDPDLGHLSFDEVLARMKKRKDPMAHLVGPDAVHRPARRLPGEARRLEDARAGAGRQPRRRATATPS